MAAKDDRPRQQTVPSVAWTRVHFEKDDDSERSDDYYDDEDGPTLRGQSKNAAPPPESSFNFSESDSENLDQNSRHKSGLLFNATRSTIERDASSQKSFKASQGLIGTVRLLQAQVFSFFDQTSTWLLVPYLFRWNLFSAGYRLETAA